MQIVNKQNALHHYQWGNGCDGWVLVDTHTLSVKQEQMPAGTAEALHYHERVRQFFFFILEELPPLKLKTKSWKLSLARAFTSRRELSTASSITQQGTLNSF